MEAKGQLAGVFPFTMWVPGSKLRSSGLVASTLPTNHLIYPSCFFTAEGLGRKRLNWATESGRPLAYHISFLSKVNSWCSLEPLPPLLVCTLEWNLDIILVEAFIKQTGKLRPREKGTGSIFSSWVYEVKWAPRATSSALVIILFDFPPLSACRLLKGPPGNVCT